jgi:hypothetical protein
VTGKFRVLATVEAVQLVDDLRNHTEVATWVEANGGHAEIPFAEPCLYIETPRGRKRAGIGDWIVRGVTGEFFPVEPDAFEAAYEPATAIAAQPQPAPGIPLRSDAETAAMLRAELDEAEAELRRWMRRWPRCPSGCNCRIGIPEDADANECGCDGPCNGGPQPAPELAAVPRVDWARVSEAVAEREGERDEARAELTRVRESVRELIGMAVSGTWAHPRAGERLRRIAQEAGIEPPAILGHDREADQHARDMAAEDGDYDNCEPTL